MNPFRTSAVIVYIIIISLGKCQDELNRNKSSNILCYICDSIQDPNCSDPFNPDENFQPKVCENGEKYCRKIFQEGE